MVDIFIRSHFNSNEKRRLFFHENPWICHTCHKPRVKARINTDDFSNGHRRLICISPRNQHAPHGPPAPAPAQANDFVTKAEFNVLQNTVNQLNINVNQLTNNVNQLTNNLNQLTNNMTQMNQTINRMENTLNQLVHH